LVSEVVIMMVGQTPLTAFGLLLHSSNFGTDKCGTAAFKFGTGGLPGPPT
jgi:hypothetical protein